MGNGAQVVRVRTALLSTGLMNVQLMCAAAQRDVDSLSVLIKWRYRDRWQHRCPRVVDPAGDFKLSTGITVL